MVLAVVAIDWSKELLVAWSRGTSMSQLFYGIGNPILYL